MSAVSQSAAKPSGAQSLSRESVLEMTWIWGTVSFLAFYLLSMLRMAGVLSVKKRAIHVLCCLSLIASYGSCVYSKTPDLNMQRLLRDGNFRCFLVFCSLLTMKTAVFPLLPFFIMSAFSLSSYVLKNRKAYERRGFFSACKGFAIYQDEGVLLAYKMEGLCIPLLLAYLLTGHTDLFVLVSYSSMVWFEYNSNPMMKKAVSELRRSADQMAKSPMVPELVRAKYALLRDSVIERLALSEKKREKTE